MMLSQIITTVDFFCNHHLSKRIKKSLVFIVAFEKYFNNADNYNYNITNYYDYNFFCNPNNYVYIYKIYRIAFTIKYKINKYVI